jgi:hypothetical protein
MQPARIKSHAKEHTNNPVQRPDSKGSCCYTCNSQGVMQPDSKGS